jgi:hypothetical protein
MINWLWLVVPLYEAAMNERNAARTDIRWARRALFVRVVIACVMVCQVRYLVLLESIETDHIDSTPLNKYHVFI